MRLFQNLVYQIKEIIGSEFGMIDDTGLILACSDENKIGQNCSIFNKIMQSKDEIVISEDVCYQKVYIKGKFEFIVFIKMDSPENLKLLTLIAINALNLKTYNDEKFDKGNFIKNVLTDSILPADIPLKAKELHISNNTGRVVFLIKIDKNKDTFAHEVIESLFPNKAKDFVVVMDDEYTVLVKELKNDEDSREVDRTARIIIDTLSAEMMIKAYVGIGTAAGSIRDIGRSYKEAQIALTVGRIFENDKAVISYDRLGIGRLIYQLPITLCKLFLNEVFKDGTIDSLDYEIMQTIQKFFENSLNVSETARQLYVHRNTLVYRLDKIQKITGLDLRNFDDAIIFKVALLVKKYLDKSEEIL